MSIESIEARHNAAWEENSYTRVRMDHWAHIEQDVPLLLAVAKAAEEYREAHEMPLGPIASEKAVRVAVAGLNLAAALAALQSAE